MAGANTHAAHPLQMHIVAHQVQAAPKHQHLITTLIAECSCTHSCAQLTQHAKVPQPATAQLNTVIR